MQILRSIPELAEIPLLLLAVLVGVNIGFASELKGRAVIMSG